MQVKTQSLSRRSFLRATAAATGAVALGACQPKVVEKIVKETVVVKEAVEVEKEVTRVVEKNVEVEKEVTRVVEKVKEVAKEVAVDWPTVRWAGKPVDVAYDVMMGLLDVWEDENKIRVLHEPIPGGWDEIAQKMLAGVAAGDAPDIWRMYGPFVRKCIDFEIANNLTPYIEKEDYDLSDFVQGQLLASQKQGGQYGVPDYCGIWLMFYNADLIEEAGLPIPDPETWDVQKYTEYAQKLTKRDSNDMLEQAGTETNNSLAFDLSASIWAYGGEVSDKDRVICRMSEPLAIDALNWKADLKWKYQVTPSAAESAALNLAGGWGIFPSGKAGFREDGIWFLCNGCGNIPAIGDKFRYGILPHVKGPTGRRETFCTTDTWMASRQSKYPDACWEFEKFLCGPERQEILAKFSNLQPARKSKAHLFADAVREVAMETNPKLEELDLTAAIEGYDYARPMNWWACDSAVMEELQPVLDQIYTTGSGTVDELIPDICKRISEITC